LMAGVLFILSILSILSRTMRVEEHDRMNRIYRMPRRAARVSRFLAVFGRGHEQGGEEFNRRDATSAEKTTEINRGIRGIRGNLNSSSRCIRAFCVRVRQFMFLSLSIIFVFVRATRNVQGQVSELVELTNRRDANRFPCMITLACHLAFGRLSLSQ
jgi:hypothetical protein